MWAIFLSIKSNKQTKCGAKFVYQIVHIENVVIMSTKLFRQNCVNHKFTQKNSWEEKVMEEVFLSLSCFCMIIYVFIMKQALLLHLWVNFIILENQQIGLKCKNAMFDSKLNV